MYEENKENPGITAVIGEVPACGRWWCWTQQMRNN